MRCWCSTFGAISDFYSFSFSISILGQPLISVPFQAPFYRFGASSLRISISILIRSLFLFFIQLPFRRMVRQAGSGVPPAHLWSCAAAFWHRYPGDERNLPFRLSVCISSSWLQPRCGTVWRSMKWSWTPTVAMEKGTGWSSQVRKKTTFFLIL